MPQLTIVIVSYNVKHYVEQCLHSVERAVKDIDAEVYVVDNHSSDGSVDYLRERFPWVTIVDSNRNLGFARANNIAIRQSKGTYVLLLNPDTVVGESVLRQCVDFLDEHPQAGAVGVCMLQSTGHAAPESRRGLPTPLTAFYKVVGLCSLFPQSKRFGRYYMGYLPWNKPGQIDVVSGAFCMLRREAINRVGLLDEDFFMYGEDIDLSARLLKKGWQNWYLPATILHYKGESTQKSSYRYVHVFYEAMLIFFRKHYGHLSLLVSLPIKLAIYLRAGIALLQMLYYRLRQSLGFSRPSSRPSPQYVFIGRSDMLQQCRLLSSRHGLSAGTFIDADESVMPTGHVGCQALSSSAFSEVYVVYDVHAFSYEHILEIFRQHPDNNIRIGTYDTTTRTLITPDDVFCS